MTDTEPAPPPTHPPDKPSTIPPPEPRWVTLVRREITDLKKAIETTSGDVKDLTGIARNCFDHLLIQEARIDKLQKDSETHDLELKNIQAELKRIRTLIPPPPTAGDDAA